MYDIERLYRPRTLAEALTTLQEHPELKIMAGGSDVLISIRGGKLAGASFVSLYELDELRGISLDKDENLHIKPLTSFSELEESPLICAYIPTLGYAAGQAGGPQLRNIGTVGGNICNGVTSADTASTLVAYEAQLTLQTANSTRVIPISEWYAGPGWTHIAPGEILTDICIPKAHYEGVQGRYIKYAMREAMDIATLGCVVLTKLSADKTTIDHCRIAFGVAAPVPSRVPGAEEIACGKPLTKALLQAVATAATEGVNPRTSWRASKEFRLHLVEELTKRALLESVEKNGGEWCD